MVDTQRWSSLGNIEIPINQVLIIDDDLADATLVKSILEHEQMRVRLAKDGGQAQALFSMHKPDFVILDLMLPGESGYEVCERFKTAEAAVPVLILTAIDLDDSRELARRVGADGYLVKPAAAADLVRTMREIAETVWERTHLGTPRNELERVRFQCRCGKKFKVSGSHRGKSLTCPQCGEPLTIPRQSTPA